MKLNTIQKNHKLNDVFVVEDENVFGTAYHKYEVLPHDPDAGQGAPPPTPEFAATIVFQKGHRNEAGSAPGVLDVDLLEIVRHRLQSFQRGDHATRENAIALTHIEEALLWMNKRVEDRAERGVLGTSGK